MPAHLPCEDIAGRRLGKIPPDNKIKRTSEERPGVSTHTKKTDSLNKDCVSEAKNVQLSICQTGYISGG